MRSRNIKKQIWLNQKEASILKKNSNVVNISEAEYIRQLILGTKLKEKPDDRFYEVMKQMRAIGNNLNQIARVANSTGHISDNDYSAEAELWNKFMIEIKKRFLL